MIKKYNAFTLIELLIVLSILSLIVSFVYPSYRQHLAKAHLNQAKLTLYQASQQLQRYYGAHHSYRGVNLKNLQTADGTYELVLRDVSDHAYQLQVIAKDKHTRCGVLGINEVDEKTASEPGCW